MKNSIKLIAFLVLTISLIACKDSPQQEIETDKIPAVGQLEPNEIKTASLSSGYDDLFYRDSNGCAIIDPKEISHTLSIPDSNVIIEMNDVELCWYQITLNDRSTSRMSINLFERDLDFVQKEIKKYRKARAFRKHLKSQNGEVHFGIHEPQGHLYIMHGSYPNIVKIGFGNSLNLKDLTKKQQLERESNVVLLANAIVNKYKN